MKIHKEGKKIIIIELIILIVIWFFSSNIFDANTVIFLKLLAVLILIVTVFFFRVPNRKFIIKDGCIYAPCDGKVVVIERTEENEYFNDLRTQVSIFMSPLNVHNNLYPINGNICYKKYHPGKHLFAWHPKSSTKNERSSIVIKNNNISILVRQIAGALARRIVTYSELHDKVRACEELGFIKFGSRVDLFLPKNIKIKTDLNCKVIGGETIIAEY